MQNETFISNFSLQRMRGLSECVPKFAVYVGVFLFYWHLDAISIPQVMHFVSKENLAATITTKTETTRILYKFQRFSAWHYRILRAVSTLVTSTNIQHLCRKTNVKSYTSNQYVLQIRVFYALQERTVQHSLKFVCRFFLCLCVWERRFTLETFIVLF